MIFAGMLRIKNEARWIDRVLRSLKPVCDEIYILDDHSTDGTQDICRSIPGVIVIESPFDGLHEIRDKDFLLGALREATRADWIVHIDGDEELDAGSIDTLMRACETTSCNALALQIAYLWDREDQVRIDGIYGRFRRPSVFRFPRAPIGFASQQQNTSGLHCTNAPESMLSGWGNCHAVLWHYGYMDRADRIRKYGFYNRIDHGNRFEDGYRHMVIGDLYPAHSQFLHGGPLQLSARDSPRFRS